MDQKLLSLFSFLVLSVLLIAIELLNTEASAADNTIQGNDNSSFYYVATPRNEEVVEVIIQERTNEVERIKSLVKRKQMPSCPKQVLRKLNEGLAADGQQLPPDTKCTLFVGWGVVLEQTPGICVDGIDCSTNETATIELPGLVQFKARIPDPGEIDEFTAFPVELADTCYCWQCETEGCGWYKAPSCSTDSSNWCTGGYFGRRCEGNKTMCTVNGVYKCCGPDSP